MHIFYKKAKRRSIRLRRLVALGIVIAGLLISTAVLLPVATESIAVSAYSEIVTPIPKRMMVTASTLQSFISQSVDTITGFDSTDAKQWFRNVPEGKPTSPVTSYTLSIPKLGIVNAEVTTIDNDLSKHLVNYVGTAVPPNKGTAAIFGHSTLPWLFDSKDYKKIFATIHTLEVGDLITAKINNNIYTYKIFEMIVVSSDSTAIFEQLYDDSYITLVTCSPPGTTWKRLLVKARLEKI